MIGLLSVVQVDGVTLQEVAGVLSVKKAYQVQPFVSAAQTITLASQIVLAHGLGARPTSYDLYLVCVTAELGFPIGTTLAVRYDAGSNRGIQIAADATNVYISIDGLALQIINGAAPDSIGAITPANWNLIAVAYP